ncbi:MAG: hypothetical protein AAF804_00795, partial [Bacteroidota bacterium]
KIPFEITVDKPGYHTLTFYQVDVGIGVDRLVICTDEQAKTAQTRALIGAPESFNTIAYAPYEQLPPSGVEAMAVSIPSYPHPDPLTEVKFNFAMYAMLDAFDYVPVNQRHVFDPNQNQFGWRATDVKSIGIHHNESSERVPFWQRDGLTGKTEAKFYVKLAKGSYVMTYYLGDARIKEEMIYNVGKNFEMSLAVNGKVLMENEAVISGIQKIDSIPVEIGEEELLEIALDGNWIINAVEIEPKR